MKRTRIVLQPDMLRLLEGIRGQTWIRWGAPIMPVSTYAVTEVFVQTRECALSLLSDLIPLEFAGYPDEYSALRVIAGAPSQLESTRAGNVFYQHQGDAVRDIVVVRDTVSEVVAGVPSWELTSDMAVAFVFDEECLAFVKGGYSTEDFFVESGPHLGSMRIDDNMGFWEPDLEHSFEWSRRIASVAQLMEEG